MSVADRCPRETLEQIMSVEGALTAEEAEALYVAAQAVKDGCIVEVGSHRGRSTAALAFGTRSSFDVPVYAIEPHEKFLGILGGDFGAHDRTCFMRNMLALGIVETIRLVNLSSEYVTASWPDAVGLLWIDGDHRYKAVKRDIACWLPHLRPDATVIFHDATDARIGPVHVAEELLATGGWERGKPIGKTVSLRRGPPRGNQDSKAPS